ncbi:MAG: acyl--CoA ligase [Bacteroidales bacterium]|nr:acyl--CoA ligase [Bacteroidales bacterium]
MNLYSNIFKIADEQPNKTALIYFKLPITYRRLSEKIKHYASSLYNMGLRPGDIVVLSLPTTPESIAITYALNIIGVISCHVDVRFTAEQVLNIIKRTKSKLLFIMDFNIKSIARITKRLDVEHIIVLRGDEIFPKNVTVWHTILDYINGRNFHFRSDKRFIYWTNISNVQQPRENIYYEWPSDSTQIIFQTSGTTGNAKCALFSAENINNPTPYFNNLINNHTLSDKILCLIPIFALYSFQASIHTPLSLGNTVDIVPIWKAKNFIRIIQRHKPQHVFSVPSNWDSITNKKNAKTDFSFLKTVIIAGDILKPVFEREINNYLKTHGHKYNIRKAYGMTETAGMVATTPDNDENKYKLGFSGRITAGHHVQICDDEICVLTSTKALGYYNDPEATANLLRQHDDGLVWLHTGDLGHLDEQGNLYVDGRIKRMIVRHDGTKIFPVEIENALTQHPQILDCAVVGIPDKNHPQSFLPAAFVTVTDSSVNTHEIRKYAQKTLPVHLQPSKIQIVKEFPLTKMNKTDYNKLSELI